MFAHVAPLLRLPRSLGIFDYRIEAGQSLGRGSLVSVRFRGRLTAGVVLSTSQRSSLSAERLRPIERVISTRPYLPDPQLGVAERVAAENFSSIATTLRSLLPTIPRTAEEINAVASAATDRSLRSDLDRMTGSRSDAVVVTYRDDRTRDRWYANLINRVRSSRRSVIVVVPTIRRAEQLVNRLPPATSFHHQLTPRQFRLTFRSIRQAESTLVVGSRSAVLAPVNALSLIMIDDEEADEHIQAEPSPRYDSRRVAMLLARVGRIKVVLTSRLPSLVSATAISRGITLDRARYRVSLVDLERERAGGDFNILTEPVMERLRHIGRHQSARVLIVHPRRSVFGSLCCHDCGFVPACPTCHVPFRQTGDQLVCNHCQIFQPIPGRCPRCGSVQLRGRSRGIESILRELRQARLPARELKPNQDAWPPGMIGLTTPAHARYLDRRYAAAVVTRFDSLLAVPRVDADEQAQRLLVTLSSRCQLPDGLIVQASRRYHQLVRQPFDPSWLAAAQTSRESFGYPPAWKLWLLRQRASARRPGLSPATLVRQLRRIGPEVIVTDTQPSPGRSPVDRAGTSILVRSRRLVPPALPRILAHLDESWTITVDPIELR
ncbi:MAG: hypothetical protein HY421_02450 [Candidatus Kerfeldbacteria bacterium]|nr:hypothetical protein [Candidatus Kerfeldbacteria bacterium]